MTLSRLARHSLVACALAGTFSLSGCLGGSANAAGEYEKVVIAMPDWAGGKANAAVAAYVLQEELGVDVELRAEDQAGAWDGLDDDSVQAVLEDWGAVPDKVELYVRKKQSVVDAGDLGITGHTGWFVPKKYADANPGVLRWENLNEYAEDLEGTLLHGDPAHATFDESIIEGLDLQYHTESAGSEGALLDAISSAGRTGDPLLAYWWEPHWLASEVEMAEVELPEYTEGCHQDPEGADCGYPEISLRKYLSADFAESGGRAAEFLRDFSWTADDQNAVAYLIEHEGMSPFGAAELWVTENPGAVEEWLAED